MDSKSVPGQHKATTQNVVLGQIPKFWRGDKMKKRDTRRSQSLHFRQRWEKQQQGCRRKWRSKKYKEKKWEHERERFSGAGANKTDLLCDSTFSVSGVEKKLRQWRCLSSYLSLLTCSYGLSPSSFCLSSVWLQRKNYIWHGFFSFPYTCFLPSVHM